MQHPKLLGSGRSPWSRLILGVALGILWSGAALAQTGTITGTVTDAQTGEPLISANVVVEGTGLGAATDLDGNYTISGVEAGTLRIRARFLGYVTEATEVNVRAGETTTWNFNLEPDLAGLEEIVVTGVASRTSRARSEVAVSRVDAAELVEEVAFQDVSQLLNGKVAGVNVQPASGNAGGGIRFNIRSGGGLNGDGQPLVILDGVRINSNQVTGIGAGGQGQGLLADLAPSDIESIDFLKGPAAAALYGTSGSNGVVLITTKRGQLSSQGEMAVRYRGVFGVNQQQTEYDDTFVSYEDANAIFRDGGISQHSLDISGGSQTVRYFASVDNRLDNGHIPNNALDRTSMRANFQVFPTDKVNVSASAGYTLNKVDRPQNDNNIFGYLGNTLLQPVSYLYTDSLSIDALQNQSRSNRFIGSVQAQYEPIENLSLNVSGGLDALDLRQDEVVLANRPISGRPRGSRQTYSYESDRVNFQADARYEYAPMTRLDASTIVGIQGFDSRVRTFSLYTRDFPTELITDIGAGETYGSSGEGFTNSRELGVFVEQGVAYDDAYFATVGLRRDFASTIGLEAPSIYYPKASLAVRLDEVVAMPSQVGLFKLRAAFGETGQLPGVLDAVERLYAAELGGYGPGAVLSSIGNVELEPERVREFEFGLDADFLAGRVGLQTTYYFQDAEDSIIDFNNAPSTGLTASAVPFNVGSISGQGLELALTAVPFRTAAHQVDLTFIYNYATNEVNDLGGAQPIYDGFSLNVIKEGLPRSAFYTAPVHGARFAANGAYAGVDVGVREDSDDCSEEDDRCFFGVPTPTNFGSVSANVQLFRDFSIYALVDYALGHKVFNSTASFAAQTGNYQPRLDLAEELSAQGQDLFGGTDGEGNPIEPIYQEGTPEFEMALAEYQEVANAYARTSGSYDANWIEDADYLKLREVSVRYDFTRLLRRAPVVSGHIRSLSVGVAARNVFTSTKYSGVDPEVNFSGSRSLTRGQDFLTLQNPRSILFNISVGF